MKNSKPTGIPDCAHDWVLLEFQSPKITVSCHKCGTKQVIIIDNESGNSNFPATKAPSNHESIEENTKSVSPPHPLRELAPPDVDITDEDLDAMEEFYEVMASSGDYEQELIQQARENGDDLNDGDLRNEWARRGRPYTPDETVEGMSASESSLSVTEKLPFSQTSTPPALNDNNYREYLACLDDSILWDSAKSKDLIATENQQLVFFDTETTGLPKKRGAPPQDTDSWPRLVQIAWIVYDEDGNLIKKRDLIIKPEGFTIPLEATKIHGISTNKALAEGVELESALNEFHQDCVSASMLIAHNLEFDINVTKAEFYRKKKDLIYPHYRAVAS